MNIIEELWYGNISTCEKDFKKGSKYSELLGYIVRHEVVSRVMRKKSFGHW